MILQEIENILSFVEDQLLEQDGDVETTDGVVSYADDRGQFVLNRHVPLQQIWLSSPISGAYHFAYTNNDWVDTRSGKRLWAVLAEELGIVSTTSVYKTNKRTPVE